MDLLPFAATALLLEVTPGPNMVWLVLLAGLQGRRAGLAAVAGIALGLLIPGLIASFGLAQAAALSPALVDLLRWGGAAYLLYLAWQSWPRGDETAAAKSAQDGALWRHFRDGLVINLLNAKSALFFLLALPEFTDRARPLLPQALALTGLYVAIATGVHLALVALAGRAHALLLVPARARALRRTGAVLIALVAAWLALR